MCRIYFRENDFVIMTIGIAIRAIIDKNYEHVLNFWKAFNLNSMKVYHGYYWSVCLKQIL